MKVINVRGIKSRSLPRAIIYIGQLHGTVFAIASVWCFRHIKFLCTESRYNKFEEYRTQNKFFEEMYGELSFSFFYMLRSEYTKGIIGFPITVTWAWIYVSESNFCHRRSLSDSISQTAGGTMCVSTAQNRTCIHKSTSEPRDAHFQQRRRLAAGMAACACVQN